MEDTGERITKTEAKAQYFLSDKDLVGIDYTRVKVKSHCGYSHLYDIDTIIQCACEKHGFAPEFLDTFLAQKHIEKDEKRQRRIAKQQREQEVQDFLFPPVPPPAPVSASSQSFDQSVVDTQLETMQKNLDHDIKVCGEHLFGRNGGRIVDFVMKTTEKTNRKMELIRELAKFRLTLRNDSTLCQEYISGDPEFLLEWPLPNIVRRMCEMKYLYDYCNMQQCREQVYQRYRRNREYYDGAIISEEAEELALRKYTKNGKYPDVFPWMRDDIVAVV